MAEQDLTSARLWLRPLGPVFLMATLAGDRKTMAAILRAEVPEAWLDEGPLARLRLGQLLEDPTLQPWLLRAMVRRSDGRMVGFIGFHGRPGMPHLANWAPRGVELGYSVFAAERRQGYAAESCAAMIDWARQTHGVDEFVLSIGLENEASQALARRLGFVEVGRQIDEEEGPELIFLLKPARG